MAEEQERPGYVRRRYYIKDFQMKFVWKFCSILAAASLFMAIIVYFLCLKSTTTAFESSRLVIKSTADFILPVLIISTSVMFVLMGACSVFIIIFQTHRVAGPIYRIEKFISSVKSGCLTSLVYLRSTDEIQELAVKCNDMAKEIGGRLDEVKKTVNHLTNIENNLNELMKDKRKKAGVQELEPLYKELADIKYKLNSQLDYFKT